MVDHLAEEDESAWMNHLGEKVWESEIVWLGHIMVAMCVSSFAFFMGDFTDSGSMCF